MDKSPVAIILRKMKNTLLFLVSMVLFSSGCGMRSIPTAENNVEAASAEVINQYKRRADLIPNLVKVVQGYAKHESETLTQVTEARAKATSMTIDPSKSTPEQIQNFQKAQGQLSAALGKLLSISENYPQLKADQNFRDLQAQLEGTENRITVARNRHIEAIQRFNNLVTVPPESWYNSIFLKKEKLPQWSLDAQETKNVTKPPQVQF